MVKGTGPRLTEAEWQTRHDLRAHWEDFCDGDPFPGADEFPERMHEARLITLRAVTRDDLQQAFASERGIEKGGSIWVLTAKGRKVLEAGRAALAERGGAE